MTPTAMASGSSQRAERSGSVNGPGSDPRHEVPSPETDGPPTPPARPAGRRRVRRTALLALAIVAAAAVLAFLPVATPPVMPARGLEAMPRTLAQWHEVATPPSQALPTDPGVTHDVSRTYERGGDSVWLSIGYYASLTPGRHPEAQRMVMPGQGYAELSVRAVQVPLDGGEMLPANLVVMRALDRTLSTLYWYHLAGRGVASDHGYRALLLWNRLWRHRSNVAVVRVVSPIGRADPEAVLAAQGDFVRALYPELRRSLPE